ncbi:unnamed protein product [Choristocarpus tenellus]
MVVIQIKRSDKDSFIVEASTTESNETLVRRVVKIWNTRIRLMQLIGGVRSLGQYGPMKPEAEHGLDEVKEEYEGIKIDKGPFYVPDPTGKRTGNGVGPQLTETFEKVCKDAELMLEQSRGGGTGRNGGGKLAAVTQDALNEKMDNIRGAVTMAFPMGLPPYDVVRMTIEGEEGLEGTSAAQELLDEETAGLWMAGKEFRKDQVAFSCSSVCVTH